MGFFSRLLNDGFERCDDQKEKWFFSKDGERAFGQNDRYNDMMDLLDGQYEASAETWGFTLPPKKSFFYLSGKLSYICRHSYRRGLPSYYFRAFINSLERDGLKKIYCDEDPIGGSLIFYLSIFSEHESKFRKLYHPDCLKEEKNPIVYYIKHANEKIIKDPIANIIALQYIGNAFLDNKDVSKEPWILNGIDGMEDMEYGELGKIIEETVEYPDYLSDEEYFDNLYSENSDDSDLDDSYIDDSDLDDSYVDVSDY